MQMTTGRRGQGHLELAQAVDSAQARDEAAEVALYDGGAGVQHSVPAGHVTRGRGREGAMVERWGIWIFWWRRTIPDR